VTGHESAGGNNNNNNPNSVYNGDNKEDTRRDYYYNQDSRFKNGGKDAEYDEYSQSVDEANLAMSGVEVAIAFYVVE